MGTKNECTDCKTYNFKMSGEAHGVVFDYQTELRDSERKTLNKYQVLQKIILEWRDMREKSLRDDCGKS